MNNSTDEVQGNSIHLDGRARLFALLTDPGSGRAARWLGYYLDGLVVVSCGMLCFESVPAWSHTKGQRLGWFGMETFVSAHFLADLVLKLVGSPSALGYLATWPALVDVLSVAPWLGEVWQLQRPPRTGNPNKWAWMTLRVLRMLRFVRFFHVTLHSVPEMRLFGKAVRRSRLAMTFLAFYLFGAGLFFSCLYFLAETSVCRLDHGRMAWVRTKDPQELCSVQSMFDAVWLVLVTMSTVGYGDISPQTVAGRMVAGAVMITSLVFLALPVALFGANLTELVLEGRLAKRILRKQRGRRCYKRLSSFNRDKLAHLMAGMERSLEEVSKEWQQSHRRLETLQRHYNELRAALYSNEDNNIKV